MCNMKGDLSFYLSWSIFSSVFLLQYFMSFPLPSAEEYIQHIPALEVLIGVHHMDPEVAMALARPIFVAEVQRAAAEQVCSLTGRKRRFCIFGLVW